MVIVVMGVSGSGKTTVGRALARAVGGEFVDADDFHSEANIARMARGIPLTDEDRAPWIEALRNAIDTWLERPGIVVLACSALSERIRQRLGLFRDNVRLVYLEGDEALIAQRMRARRHFMPPELLASQLAILEPPRDALTLEITKPIDELVEEIRVAFGL